MAKQIVKAAAVFAIAVAFVGSASAGLLVSSERTYAAELFGDGSSSTVFDYGEDGSLYVDVLVKNGTDIGTSDEAVLSISLTGAEFAQSVGTGDLSLVVQTVGRDADMMATFTSGTPTNLPASKRDGGARGDTHVEFDLVDGRANTISAYTDADSDGVPDDATTLTAVRIELPPLRNVSSAGVHVSVELEGTTTTSNWPDFPPEGAPRDGTAALFTKAAPAMMVTAEDGSGLINVDDRTMLDSKVQVMGAATVTLDVDEAVLQSDGNPFSVQDRRHSDGAGDVIVTVVGNFQEGDQVAWEWNGARGIQDEEVLTVGEGVAERAFDLDALFIDPNEDQRPGAVGGAVLYIPGGKDPLRNGEMRVTAVVDYDLSSLRDSVPYSSTGTLRYSKNGVALHTVKAYALAPMSSGDETNVRLRCGQSFDCTVYMACDAADGAGFFGKMDDEVSPWSVMTVDSGMIADVIGADDGDFAGRMSCEVIGATQVQVLTRSDGVLVNNSYVGQ